ncbi:PTS mannose/fructose/sorbose transporter subunit IIB [Liquorilactobacillus satsumensis]|uniref:PTS mannose/fructose/sorbose transporter subunit IIB n=1 Tax=Liquorilactobacillus hordei TaxID=468911 RepID=A0A3S6QSQ2_9LACO|nr:MULTISPECIES: PTS sugar transporter subunit IIB [Liquorilactobacillus]AUJ31028.1 PTS mannose/fructose/sorbose transporter subunit IIB [Liquorilactobacillus hordei]MCC7667590.1 PTS mannose/fructose/sorbose transporter subunit IIB [Liquorilactobacillus satsumensis]
MIVATRVDHRLVHGQVAFSWTFAINANCILVANDSAASDEMQMTTLKLAAPQGVKVVVKSVSDSIDQINSGVTDKYKLFIVVKSVRDAYQLIKGCPRIKALNVGGTKKIDGTDQVTSSVFLNFEDKEELKELSADGVDISSQMVPNDKKNDFMKKL